MFNLCLEHVHKYAAVFSYFVDILICYILINFPLNYKVEINYAPIKKKKKKHSWLSEKCLSSNAII